MIGIYRITERASGKVYIGQSICIEKRWKQHQRSRPPEMFDYAIQQECVVEELDRLEKHYIIELNTSAPSGLNRSAGGRGCRALHGNKHCVGRILSEETKAKISSSAKGRSMSDETKLKLSASRTGKPNRKRTDEQRARYAEAANRRWQDRSKKDKT